VVSTAEGLVEWEGERLRVALNGAVEGDDVTVSLRPEKLALLPENAPADGRNRLRGELEVVTFLGPYMRLEVSVHGRSLWVDVPHGGPGVLARKTPVALAFAPADCVVIASPAAVTQ